MSYGASNPSRLSQGTGGYAGSPTGGYSGTTGGYATGAASGGAYSPQRASATAVPASGGSYSAGSGGAYSAQRTSTTAAPTSGGYASGGSAYVSPSSSYSAPPGASPFGGQQQQQQSAWVLEPVQYAGLPYVLDRATGMVYTNNQGWMQLVGQWQNGQLVQRVRNGTGELFKALDDLLRTQQVRLPSHLPPTLSW